MVCSSQFEWLASPWGPCTCDGVQTQIFTCTVKGTKNVCSAAAKKLAGPDGTKVQPCGSSCKYAALNPTTLILPGRL
jgi:hypothetical protein